MSRVDGWRALVEEREPIRTKHEPNALSIVSEREPETVAVCKPSPHRWRAATARHVYRSPFFCRKGLGSLWIPDCFGVRRQSGATESSPGDRGSPRICREPGHQTPRAPRRWRFPLAATLVRGVETSLNPKRRQTSAPKQTLWFRRVPRISVGASGYWLPPHSKRFGRACS